MDSFGHYRCGGSFGAQGIPPPPRPPADFHPSDGRPPKSRLRAAELACLVDGYGTPSSATQLSTFFLLSKALNRDIAIRIMHFNTTYTQQDREVDYRPVSWIVSDVNEGYPVLRSQRIRIPSNKLTHGVKRIHVEVTGHDQGWADNRDGGSWTWYTIALMKPKVLGGKTLGQAQEGKSQEQSQKGSKIARPVSIRQVMPWAFEGKQPEDKYEPKWVLEIGRNAVADESEQQHSFTFRSDEFGKKYLSEIEDGDVIEIRACASFPGWQNHVCDAKIMIDLPGI